MQIATWAVASVPIIINGCLLLDFFSSEVKGLLSGLVLFAAVLAYVSFLLYLIFRGIAVFS